MGKVCVHMNWRDKLGKKNKTKPRYSFKKAFQRGYFIHEPNDWTPQEKQHKTTSGGFGNN